MPLNPTYQMAMTHHFIFSMHCTVTKAKVICSFVRAIFKDPLALLSDDTKASFQMLNLHFCPRPIIGLSTFLTIGVILTAIDEKQIHLEMKKQLKWM